ncbi:hypothetical protein [Alicyclobacillus mengziensis]|uniref:Uncharacterized protein n=1 Tax=Alicyclobacillus mengziensis TaxID=2931921 RepID=A0A9X7VX81_9BACL|nr:hypothetical protein [Alicyclobacillus mengziensis]QSO45398.1 hypothetical protein JZ786_12425 [Alicyclobacillus mengziensis]
MAKQAKVWLRFKRQLLSAAAVVAVVAGGVWFSSHPLRIGGFGFFAPLRSNTDSVSSGSSHGQSGASSANVNDPNQQKLQTILDGISGMQQVALESGSNGETITVTISVPVGSSLKTIENNLITQYMSDVFDTDPLIQKANVYFISDGQFLAGGGLSRAAYKEWSVSATSGQQNNVQKWMATLSNRGTPGSATGWFGTASPPPSGN